MKILITDTVHESGLAYLRERGYELKFTKAVDEDTLIRELQDCDGVIIRGTKFPERIFKNCPHLKVAGKHGVGADNIDVAAAAKLGIRVVNTPVANYTSVAEQAAFLLMGCAKRAGIMMKAAHDLDYSIRTRIFTDDLEGKSLGLIGFGRIGSKFGSIAANGFGMKVYVNDPYIKSVPDWAELIPDRDQLLPQVDYVSIHLPLMESTYHNFGEHEFSLMKPTAFFINTARGAVVDEAALIRALEQGTIAGAGLDVTEDEPPKADNPLLRMDSVILMPHNAASTADSMYRMSLHVAQGVDAVLSGREPEWSLA